MDCLANHRCKTLILPDTMRIPLNMTVVYVDSPFIATLYDRIVSAVDGFLCRSKSEFRSFAPFSFLIPGHGH